MGRPDITWHEVGYNGTNQSGGKEIIISESIAGENGTVLLNFGTTAVGAPSKIKCVVAKFTWDESYSDASDSEDMSDSGYLSSINSVSDLKFWLHSKEVSTENQINEGWQFFYGYAPQDISVYDFPEFKTMSDAIRGGGDGFSNASGVTPKLIEIPVSEPTSSTNISDNPFTIYNFRTKIAYSPYIFISFKPSYNQGDGLVSAWTYRTSFTYR